MPVVTHPESPQAACSRIVQALDLESLTQYLSGQADERTRDEIGRRLLVRGGDLAEMLAGTQKAFRQMFAIDEVIFEGMTEEEFSRLVAGDESVYVKYRNQLT